MWLLLLFIPSFILHNGREMNKKTSLFSRSIRYAFIIMHRCPPGDHSKVNKVRNDFAFSLISLRIVYVFLLFNLYFASLRHFH